MIASDIHCTQEHKNSKVENTYTILKRTEWWITPELLKHFKEIRGGGIQHGIFDIETNLFIKQ